MKDEVFQYLRDLETRNLEFQLSMAKWVIASSLLVNGGALIALMSAAKEYPSAAAQGSAFAVGVILALVGGVCAWLSTGATVEALTDRMDWATLTVQDPVTADRWDLAANAFRLFALLAVLVSIGAFGIGALRVQDSIAQTARAAAIHAALEELHKGQR